jgi:predicted nucleic acid-binding protein
MTPLLRVVVDINIFVSAHFFSVPDAPPRQVYEAALELRYQLLHTTAFCDDLRDVLGREKFASRLALIGSTIDELVQIVIDIGQAVTPVDIPSNVIRDKDE